MPDKLAVREEVVDNNREGKQELCCTCRKPQNNRFMICCDVCQFWYHGECVNVSEANGLLMEKRRINWECPDCLSKKKGEPSSTELTSKVVAEEACTLKETTMPKSTEPQAEVTPTEAAKIKSMRVVVYDHKSGKLLIGSLEFFFVLIVF